MGQLTLNQLVVGSIPTRLTKDLIVISVFQILRIVQVRCCALVDLGEASLQSF